MPFWITCYHLIWATKDREPFIGPSVEKHLYPFLIARSRELGVYVHALGGSTDHVHLIVSIPPNISVAHVVKTLKGASSHMLNQGQSDSHFAWQRGYGVVTLGQRQRAEAVEYVRQQQEHHRARTTNAWLERESEHDEGPVATEGCLRLQTSGDIGPTGA